MKYGVVFLIAAIVIGGLWMGIRTVEPRPVEDEGACSSAGGG